MPPKAIILAAGRGTRMGGGDLPKVMRPAAGRPLLAYVLRALDFIPPQDIVIVVGYQKEQVIGHFGPSYTYAEQTEQLGTGHAVMSAEAALSGYDGPVLIACGDMPLVRPHTYRALYNAYTERGDDLTLLAGRSTDNLPYGRVLSDETGAFLGIVEDKDCTPEQKNIKALNAGLYVVSSSLLFPALGRLNRNNAQGEYYLTDVPGLLVKGGRRVGVYQSVESDEILGVNTPDQITQVEAVLAREGLLFR